MNCLRCGVETENEEAFCENCRQEMAKYPVKPGTPVLITPREENDQERKPQKRRRRPGRLTQLRRLILWLVGIIVLLTIVICILGALLLQSWQAPEHPNNYGTNYNTVNTTQPD